MKKIFFTFLSATLFCNVQLMAQWFTNGSTVVYTTDNAGIGTSAPAAKLHVNSASTLNALRVQIAGTTRFLVHSNGGTSIGSFTTPPATGLFVSGNTGLGISSPAAKLHISGGTDVEPSSGGFLITGSASGTNIGIDDNEIMARNNHATATLFLNNDGGLVHTGGDLDVGGADVSFGSVETISDAGANTIGTNSSFIPTSTSIRTLGNSDHRWASGYFTNVVITSDLRLKKDIKELNYGLKEIMQLRPVKFNYIQSVDQKTKMGFIAQEMQKVLPEAVIDYDIQVDEATGKAEKVPAAYLGISYESVIPVLIRSIQQQQEMIEAQNKKIDELTKTIHELNSNSISNKTPISTFTPGTNLLMQNSPNPFNRSTTIRYNIPSGFKNAAIVITNSNGQTLKQYSIPSSGAGTLTINGGSLASGTYNYTLIADGKILDSKKMVLTIN